MALLYDQPEVTRFLLSQGAPYIVSDGSWTMNTTFVFNHFLSCSLIDLDISASDTMMDYIKCFATDWYRKALNLYADLNMLQSLQLSRLHNATLGISCENVAMVATVCRGAIDEPDVLGRTALHWAALIEDERAIRTLLFHGANPGKRDLIGVTPMHLSAATGAITCVQAFLDAGAAIDQRGRVGHTAIHYAAASGSVPVLELLLQYQRDPNPLNHFGEPPMIIANHAHQPSSAQSLINHGASLTIQDNWGYDALLDAVLADAHDNISLFFRHGFKPQNHLHDGRTVLHIAALHSDLRTIQLLMKFDLCNVDPHARDRAGYTALEYMQCRRNNNDVLEPFLALILKAKFDNTRDTTYDSESYDSSDEEIFHDTYEFMLDI